MGVKFNIKSKTAGSYATADIEKNGKQIKQFVTTSLKQQIASVAGTAVVESIVKHNERVLMQTAIFFQRVVCRTPKDEKYKADWGWHSPDKDYVWKNWKVLYYRSSVTAEEMGEELFDDESKFNDKACITQIASILKDRLFGGDSKFYKRTRRIKSIRIENTHPRFALLEYGGYEVDSAEINEGEKHLHGVKEKHSIQAPYGMLRITQAEMEEMNISDFDAWFKDFEVTGKARKLPTKPQAEQLISLIEHGGKISENKIDKIAEIMK